MAKTGSFGGVAGASALPPNADILAAGPLMLGRGEGQSVITTSST